MNTATSLKEYVEIPMKELVESSTKLTMQDEHGGYQRFFFQWLEWPRVQVPTFRPTDSEIYLENLARLFYIDQNEGWTNIQSLQISRYGQLEISEIAIEYLLAATDSLNRLQNPTASVASLRRLITSIPER